MPINSHRPIAEDDKSLKMDLSPEQGRLEAFQDSLARHVPAGFDFKDAAVQVGNELMRYAREREVSNQNRERLKQKSKRIIKAAEKLFQEIEADDDIVRDVWRLSAAPNWQPEGPEATRVYEERLKQIQLWNADVGSAFAFSMKLERVIQGARQTLSELSPRGRPIDLPKLGLGVFLACFWNYATGKSPTPSNSGDFENPGTAFGWFAKRSIELLTQHDEFVSNFPGFVESAVNGSKRS